MKIKNIDVKNYMTLRFSFNGVRIFDNTLSPVEWDLKVNLVGIDTEGLDPEQSSELGSIAYQKIYFWLESNLPNVVITDVNNDIGFNVCNVVDNMMMYCPDEASDDLIVQLLHSKLWAIGGKHIHIGEMVLTSSDTSASYTFNGPEEQSYILPKKTTDYIEAESLYASPWWDRNDGFCFEFIKLDKTDTTPIEEVFESVSDPLAEYERSLLVTFSDVTDDEPAEILHVKSWNPKTI